MELELKGVADAIITFVREHRAWAGPIVLLLAFGESIAFVSLILPFWGMLVALGVMIGGNVGSVEFWTILTCAAVGAALGDWVSYWLGQHYHEQIARDVAAEQVSRPAAARARLLPEVGCLGDRARPLLRSVACLRADRRGRRRNAETDVPVRQLDLGVPVGWRAAVVR